MVATPLSPTRRYFVAGTRKYYWLATASNYNSLTRPELDAGTDLTGEVVAGGVDGFQPTSDTVDVPDADTRFTKKIGGRITVDDSSIMFYTSDDSDDVRTLLPRDTEGYIVVLPEGDVASQLMDVYPVTVISAPKENDTEDSGRITINFAITDIPAENVTIPA